MKKFLAVILCIALVGLLSSCTDEKLKRNIAELNEISEITIEQYNRTVEFSKQYTDQIIQAAIYNNVTEELVTLFIPTTDSDNVVSLNFAENISSGNINDLYDKYLLDTAKEVGCSIPEIQSRLEEFKKASSETQAVLYNWENFSMYEYQEIYHNYFTRIGRNTVTEIIVLSGQGAKTLTIHILWQEDKIVDIIRYY